MKSERRRHERFPLKLSAQRIKDNKQVVELQILELSVGGCFVEWFEEAAPGYKFCLSIPRVDGNFMPLSCKVIFRFPGKGIGIQFVNINQSEQEALAEIIMDDLARKGFPAANPFAPPAKKEELVPTIEE